MDRNYLGRVFLKTHKTIKMKRANHEKPAII